MNKNEVYVKLINKMNPEINLNDGSEYKRSEFNGIKVLDLFAGAGGLSLGFRSAGFLVHGIEANEKACLTHQKMVGLCENRYLTSKDKYLRDEYDVVVGGPPCQPFSTNGKKAGQYDSRDGFPAWLRAIQQIRPKVCLFENVKGLTQGLAKWYLASIVNKIEKLGYNIDIRIVKAVELGVPQRRERLVCVGVRKDLKKHISLKIDVVDEPVNTWDALADIYDERELVFDNLKTGKLNTGWMATYWIDLKQPARTLTAAGLATVGHGLHIRLLNGKYKSLSIREAARLQSFPDWFEFDGNRTDQMRMIGNSVPPLMSRWLAEKVKEVLV